MERLSPIPVEIGGQASTPDGGRVTAHYEDPRVARRDNATVEDVHDHEANHAGVALATGTNVIHLRTIRRGNVLGSVLADRPNKLVAAVTWGRPGAWDDEEKTKYMGGDKSTAAEARSIAVGVQDGINEIAKAAAVEGELSGHEVEEAFKDGMEGREVIIFSIAADRRKRKEKTRIKGHVAEVIPLFPGVEENIPKAA